MKKLLLFCCILLSLPLAAQTDSLAIQPSVSDPIYNRPFISLGGTRTAVGGYIEGNTNYFAEDGISEGFSMELRRFNIFLFSSITDRIRFLSELEFEHGTEEISLETALVDFRINPSLVFRAGILLPPLGYFNLNHDSPKWDIIDRPLVSTRIIPSTFSEAGFGFNGKFYPENLVLTYDIYVTQGLADGIIVNPEGRTSLQQGKREAMFAEDNNGSPAFTGKVGLIKRNKMEVGISYYGGIYNSFRMEGEQVAPKRWLHLAAVDWNVNVKQRLIVVGEAAYVSADIPSSLTPVFGEKQWGVFTDFIYPVLKQPILGWEKSVINTVLRLERVDFNYGQFNSENLHDEITAIAAGISYRPDPGTVLRANYRYEWHRDLPGNPAVKRAGIQVGIASYF